jgi:serine phosphatase RsbU (regulator of sigma subunit)/PAS domain-containing protein
MKDDPTDDPIGMLAAGMASFHRPEDGQKYRADRLFPHGRRRRRHLTRSDDALRSQTDVLRSILHGMADGVVFADEAGRVFLFNPAAERLLGSGVGDARLEDWPARFGCYLADERTPFPVGRLPLLRALRGEAVDDAEMFIRAAAEADGTWLCVNARPLRDGAGALWGGVAVLRDITERRRAEQALAATRDEFQAARRIQQKMFPAAAPRLPGFDLGGASHPAEATGGDYFDFVPMLDGCVGLVVGDVSGHGFGSALLMAEARAFLRALARAHADVATILTLANAALAADVEDDRFLTLIFARLDPRTRTLRYGSAGHPTGYVLDRSGAVTDCLPSLDPPLGPFPDHVFSASPERALCPGETVVLLTDGVLEACAPDDTVFGIERALALVRAYRHAPAAQIVANLYHAVRAFTHNEPQVDDMTAIVLKVGERGT